MVDTFHEITMEKTSATPKSNAPAAPAAPAAAKAGGGWKCLALVALAALSANIYVSNIKSTSYSNVWNRLSPRADAPNFTLSDYISQVTPLSPESAKMLCPQVLPLAATNDNYSYFHTDEFRKHSLALMQGAVRIPTESYDDSGDVGQDPRWDVFFKFEEYLKASFPTVYQKLTLERVNTHALVFTWKGTNATAPPVMLAAHQDVVPVSPDTLGQWDQPPYNAVFDGTVLHGRGSSDDKNPLIAIMEAFEILLTREPEFQPKHTIIAAFGFDEETGGSRGAANINLFLQQRYGKHSFHSIIDEGGSGVMEAMGVKVALPGVSEKGIYNSEVVLHTPGGHSSMPPDHTGIGIMGALAVEIENNPFPVKLTSTNPFYKFLQCVAVNSNQLPPDYKQAIYRAGTDPIANQIVTSVLSQNIVYRGNLQTVQALDIINGGNKINALPEEVTLVSNFRISPDSSVNATRTKVINNVQDIAKKFGLGLRVNVTIGNNTLAPINGSAVVVKELIPPTKLGYFEVADYDQGFMEPAPVSPSSGPAWDQLAGTLRFMYENFAGPIIDPMTGNTAKASAAAIAQGRNYTVVVAPSLMNANTDTRHYWDLCNNIYRFTPLRVEDLRIGNIHAVNEYLPIDIHYETVVFYYSYIKNLNK